ncbi:MAG: MoaD/ThiS family protein, partial [Candidatus Bathyarchaeia archaeon]
RTVRELLQGLTAKFGERFEAALLGEDGALKHDAVLLLNQAVLTMRELGRVLKTGDRVTLYQTISGG